MVNNIDFSIIRERALRNIREDLVTEWADTFEATDIQDTFDAVKAKHKGNAVVDDFVPVLVEADMKNRLRNSELDATA